MTEYTFLLLRPTSTRSREIVAEVNTSGQDAQDALWHVLTAPHSPDILYFQVGQSPLGDLSVHPGDQFAGHGFVFQLDATSQHLILLA